MRYRRMVLLEKGRTERERGDAFPCRLFAFLHKGESLLLSGHTGVLRTQGRAVGWRRVTPARSETPEDQFRDTDTTTRNMETPL